MPPRNRRVASTANPQNQKPQPDRRERTIQCHAHNRLSIRSVIPIFDVAEPMTRFAPDTLQNHTHLQQVA